MCIVLFQIFTPLMFQLMTAHARDECTQCILFFSDIIFSGHYFFFGRLPLVVLLSLCSLAQ